MYDGYVYFNNTEIANNERTVAYLLGDPLGGFPGLKSPSTSVTPNCGCNLGHLLWCDQGAGTDGAYTTPELDEAPWYDPAVPESAEFAGLFITKTEGWDSVVSRSVIEGAIGGSALGPLRFTGRTVTFEGWLRAKTCCAAEYGLQWLTEALVGNTLCQDCSLADLYMVKCCPSGDDATCHIAESSTSQFRQQAGVTVTVTALGAGLYQLVIDDPDRINLVSYPEGVINNFDGFLSACLDGSNPAAVAAFDLVLAGNPAVTNFQIPRSAVVGAPVLVASGTGGQITLTVDSTVMTGAPCEYLLSAADIAAPFDETVAAFGDGVSGSAITTAQGRCQQFADGPDPQRFGRTLHRAGLVSGPTVVDRMGNCCNADCGKTDLLVRFTVASELPYLFSDVEWCLLDDTFPRGEVYCIDLEWCRTCTNVEPPQTAYVKRPRPECRVVIRYDGTWCPQGWSLSAEGCPPEDCTIVAVVEDFDPAGATTGGASGDDCLINLNNDGTWSGVNFDANDGFVPEYCNLSILNPNGGVFDCHERTNCTSGGGSGNVECNVTLTGAGTGAGFWTASGFNPALDGLPPDGCTLVVAPICDPDADPDETECPIRLIYDVPTGIQRWEAIGQDSGCDCYVIAETCVTGTETCLVRIVYNEGTGEQTWEPIRWDGNVNNASCTCFEIAEIIVIPAVVCSDLSDCPVNVQCDVEYRPNQCTTRQATASFFYRYNGSPAFVPPTTPTFIDVGTSNAFYLEIEWAASVGLMTGFANGSFQPELGISRQAAAVVFYRDAGSPVFVPPVLPTFSDVPNDHAFYLEIEWAYSERLFLGFADGTFRPATCWSRRAAAIVFYRYAGIAPTFLDVPEASQFFVEIEWSYDQGIFTGFADSTFRPALPLTRRAAAITLYRAAGSPPFIPPGIPTYTDVPVSATGYREIEWASANSIIAGFGPLFLPDQAFAREDAAVAFYQLNGAPPFVPPAVPSFTDVPLIHPYYLEIEWVAANGIILGFFDGTFRPSNDTTRQAMAAFFYRNAGSPPFVPVTYTPTPPPYFFDVPEPDANYNQIEWMRDAGITTGFVQAKSWQPLGWTYDSNGVFPPANCNIYVETVNGVPQSNDPILVPIEVPAGEFVPDCGPLPLAPPDPFFIEDVCYCEPWGTFRICCTFEHPVQWNDATTYIEIKAGSADIRNMKIQAFQNPFAAQGVPCPCDPNDDFWKCRSPCATLLVPHLPTGSKLIIDSRTRISEVQFASGLRKNGLRFIGTEGGEPFDWFDIGPCSNLCMVVSADCTTIADDAAVSIGLAERYIASGG